MTRPRTQPRRIVERSPAIRAVQLCVLLLVTTFGGIPLLEVHAHAGGEHTHSHDTDHAIDPGDLPNPPTDEAELVPHFHESTVMTPAMPEVEAIALDDPQLSSPAIPRLVANHGIEPPVPPRRPPIA